MLDEHLTLLALRNRLLTVEFSSTGTVTLAATGNGFTRATGSFVTDGLAKGMEVTPVGFTDNTVGVIQSVTALTITLKNARPVEAASSGRSLSVKIPELRAWENESLSPNNERWHLEEEYISGPNVQDTIGALGHMSHNPIYINKIYGLPDVGAQALYKMAGAILDVFQPRLALTLSNGTVVRVRAMPAPERGQVLYDDGNPVVVVTIPLWARTQNSI